MKNNHMTRTVLFATALMLILWTTTIWAQTCAAGCADCSTWRVHDWNRPRPAIVTPPAVSTQKKAGSAPSDAIVLFDGTDMLNWRAMDGGPAKWIVKSDYMESVRGAGYVRTLQGFGDCQLHVEFMTPTPPAGSSQGRGNSGVFLMGVYEVQVLDSYDNVTYADGQCSAIYGQYPPQVNACRKPGEWQTYDIIFKAPKFDDVGDLVKPAVITVLQNGILTQDHVEIKGPTNWCSRSPYAQHPGKLPLSFQDHGNPVRYRNVWVRELPAKGKPDAYRTELIYGDKELEKFVGSYENQGGGTVQIRSVDGQLYSSHPGGSSGQPIYAEAETRFYSKFVDAEYEFVVDGDVVKAIKVAVTHGGWSEYKKIK